MKSEKSRRSQRLVIAGGSGFIGSALASAFVRDGYEVVVLSRARSTQSGPLRYVQWDGCNPGLWTTELEGANFIVNLSGSSVNCRHNEHNRRRLIDSRIKPVMALGAAIIAAENPPPVWINASGAGIYPESETPQGEDVLATGDDFIARLAREWERAFFSCPVGGTRQVALRLGMVLGKEGGAWPTLRRLAMLGGGGRNGSGNQMVSWIHLTDVCRIIQFVATHDELEGPVNAVSPYPLKNKEFMAKLRRYNGAVPGIPQPEWLVKAGAWLTGTDASLALRGNNVYPSKLLEAGFQFTYALADDAMAELSGRKTVV